MIVVPSGDRAAAIFVPSVIVTSMMTRESTDSGVSLSEVSDGASGSAGGVRVAQLARATAETKEKSDDFKMKCVATMGPPVNGNGYSVTD